MILVSPEKIDLGCDSPKILDKHSIKLCHFAITVNFGKWSL